jgi:hypothetical protein
LFPPSVYARIDPADLGGAMASSDEIVEALRLILA